jgi:V/A-type H+-transporting ATPase subunit E
MAKMTFEEDSLRAFSEAVQGKAQADADRVLAGADAQADDIRRRSRAAAEAEREAILARARNKAERIRDQAVAAARLQGEMRKLAGREQVLAEAFAAARPRLAGVGRRADYDRVLRTLLRDALAALGAEAAVIRADPQARTILAAGPLADLSREANVRLTLGPELPHGTGVIVETADGRRRYDNTLETRLERMQDRLRARVFQLLAGDGR